ncbi:hypothetical protein PC112_g16368, partial [Phytophthora cactorum]
AIEGTPYELCGDK